MLFLDDLKIIPFGILYNILIKFGLPKKLVKLIKTCLDGTQSKVKLGNYLSWSFPIENGLKQGDALLPQLVNFALEYAIRKVQETRYEWHHQILAFADEVDLIGDGIRTIERNAECRYSSKNGMVLSNHKVIFNLIKNSYWCKIDF